MLRFPNPSSDTDALVRTFQALFERLRTHETFELDDISRALVSSNLATSSGHIGDEALRRSTRADRSRDPLFNQSKMYSELFRLLGWIHPSPQSRQRFYFTFLGAHVGLASGVPSLLVQECMLGIEYPNPLVAIRGDHRIRPFMCILKTAAALDGRISRDEMILGPLSLTDDRDQRAVRAMVQRLAELRRRRGGVATALARFSREVGVQVPHLQNYTRFPLGVLRSCGWTQRQRDGSGVIDVLTEGAHKLIESIAKTFDIRGVDLASADASSQLAFHELAFYRMMERSGYSLQNARNPPSELEQKCRTLLGRLRISDTSRILFSPFQGAEPALLARCFSPFVDAVDRATTVNRPVLAADREAVAERPVRTARLVLNVAVPVDQAPVSEEVVNLLRAELTNHANSIAAAAGAVFTAYRGAGKERFYPAVAALFRVLGFDCEHSRTGVNYQRMDALIRDAEESMPIEIKSPAEHEFLAVKGVRQALENKIVLLSRSYAPTRRETTSLVVGYEAPNDRSEVMQLIEDIFAAYGLSIGVIDFGTLLRAAAIRLVEARTFEKASLTRLRGVMELEDTR